MKSTSKKVGQDQLGWGVVSSGQVPVLGSCPSWERVSSVDLRAQSPGGGQRRPCNHMTGLRAWGGEVGIVGEGEENPLWRRAGVNAVCMDGGACTRVRARARVYVRVRVYAPPHAPLSQW